MQRFFLVLSLLTTTVASGQLPQIRISGIFPPGAQRGTTLNVVVTAGTDLDEAAELIFSDSRLKASPKLDAKGQPVANQFTVVADPTLEPGLYDVRVSGLFGISNPRVFRIDTISEIVETEPNNTDDKAQLVAINSVVNAKSNTAGDVDIFQVDVKAKQTIVIRSEAAMLDSLMQPVLELFDAQGRRVAHSRRRRQQEAVIVYTSAADQKLLLKVHDTVYAGSNDYGYRVSVDTRPHVDFTVPAVLSTTSESAGIDASITLFGRHLPGGEVTQQSIDGVPLMKKQETLKVQATTTRTIGTDSIAASISGFVYSGIEGNLLRFALVGAGTPHVEAAPADAKSPAQTITVPANVSGNFAVEMDIDTYRFTAKKGEKWQVDILAERLGSAADPLLIVEQVTVDAEGKETVKQLGREEASKQNPGGNNLPTLTTDPSFTLSVPADGIYQLRLKDRYSASRGAADLWYAVSIQTLKPDFTVVVFDSLPSTDGKVPAGTGAVSVRKGGTYEIPIYAYRQGGHNDEIKIVAKGIPDGITISEAVIPAGRSSTQLVITAAPDAKESFGKLNLMAVSTSGETRGVKVATLVHDGANGLPRTGRVASSLMLSVMKDEEPVHLETGITTTEVSQDQQLLIPLKVTRRAGFDNKVDVIFSGQPANVDVPKVSIEKGKDTAVARFYFKENAAVGPASLLMHATAQVSYSRNPWQVERAKVQVAQAVAQLEATKKAVIDAKAVADAGVKKTAELTAMLKTHEAQLVAEQTAQTKTQADLKAALATRAAATQQLVALQAKLNAAAANTKPENEDLDAAIKAVQEAAAAAEEAAKPITALSAQLTALQGKVQEQQKAVAMKMQQISEAKAAMAAQQKAVEKANADMAAAQANVKSLEAAKKAADAVVTKAQAAAKPQNKNVRAVAIPVRIVVHKTAGKITAAVPGGGAIKKGASIDVKVTLVRKNGFAGPVKVVLLLPDGESRIASNTVEIAADKTEATLKLTAKADAAAGDITNGVIRATAEFEGRPAGFDVPVALKVTD